MLPEGSETKFGVLGQLRYSCSSETSDRFQAREGPSLPKTGEDSACWPESLRYPERENSALETLTARFLASLVYLALNFSVISHSSSMTEQEIRFIFLCNPRASSYLRLCVWMWTWQERSVYWNKLLVILGRGKIRHVGGFPKRHLVMEKNKKGKSCANMKDRASVRLLRGNRGVRGWLLVCLGPLKLLYQNTTAYKWQKLIAHGSGTWKSEIRVPVWWMRALSESQPSRCVLTCLGSLL